MILQSAKVYIGIKVVIKVKLPIYLYILIKYCQIFVNAVILRDKRNSVSPNT